MLFRYDDGKDIDEPQPRGRLNSKTPSEENIVLDIGMDTFSVQNIHERFVNGNVMNPMVTTTSIFGFSQN